MKHIAEITRHFILLSKEFRDLNKTLYAMFLVLDLQRFR